MDYTETLWDGFRKIEFPFEGRIAVLVFPEMPAEGNKWLFKTEYFGAFPGFEKEMLRKGYYLAALQNKTRWCAEEDVDIKPRFCQFLLREFGLNERCLPVGMSCGGMHAVYFAARYPQYVAALYLDAPVLNLLSCPCGVGMAGNASYEEFVRDTGLTVSQLINYRRHPIDYAPVLVEKSIPVFLVCGDSDYVVPYCENGEILFNYFNEKNGNITQILKEGCGHHPHGLEDNTPLVAFAQRYY